MIFLHVRIQCLQDALTGLVPEFIFTRPNVPKKVNHSTTSLAKQSVDNEKF
jgi:hypothetical protein